MEGYLRRQWQKKGYLVALGILELQDILFGQVVPSPPDDLVFLVVQALQGLQTCPCLGCQGLPLAQYHLFYLHINKWMIVLTNAFSTNCNWYIQYFSVNWFLHNVGLNSTLIIGFVYCLPLQISQSPLLQRCPFHGSRSDEGRVLLSFWVLQVHSGTVLYASFPVFLLRQT